MSSNSKTKTTTTTTTTSTSSNNNSSNGSTSKKKKRESKAQALAAVKKARIEYHEKLFENFRCPISLAILVDPIIAADGQIYERESFKTLAGDNEEIESPITRQMMSATNFFPIQTVRNTIGTMIENQGRDVLPKDELADYYYREANRCLKDDESKAKKLYNYVIELMPERSQLAKDAVKKRNKLDHIKVSSWHPIEIITEGVIGHPMTPAVQCVSKQVHPNLLLSIAGIGTINDYLSLLMGMLGKNLHRFSQAPKYDENEEDGYGNERYIGEQFVYNSRAVQSCVRSMFPGELAKHAVSEGTKAVTKYFNSDGVEELGANNDIYLFYQENKDAFSATRLQFDILECGAGISQHVKHDITITSAIFITGVIEYICAEILELAGNAARDLESPRILPRHIVLAIEGDEELDLLFGRRYNPVINAGIIVHIHRQLKDALSGGNGWDITPAEDDGENYYINGAKLTDITCDVDRPFIFSSLGKIVTQSGNNHIGEVLKKLHAPGNTRLISTVEDVFPLQSMTRIFARAGIAAFTENAANEIREIVVEFVSNVMKQSAIQVENRFSSVLEHNDVAKALSNTNIISSMDLHAKPLVPCGLGCITFGVKPIFIVTPRNTIEPGNTYIGPEHNMTAVKYEIDYLSNHNCNTNQITAWEKAAQRARNAANFFVEKFTESYKGDGFKAALKSVGFDEIEELYRSNNNDDKMTDQEVKQIAPILCGNEEGHTDENYVKMLNEISLIWSELERRATYRMHIQEDFDNLQLQKSFLAMNAAEQFNNHYECSMSLEPSLKLDKTVLEKKAKFNKLVSLNCRIASLWENSVADDGTAIPGVREALTTNLGVPNDSNLPTASNLRVMTFGVLKALNLLGNDPDNIIAKCNSAIQAAKELIPENIREKEAKQHLHSSILRSIYLEQMRGGSFINHVDFFYWIVRLMYDYKEDVNYWESSVAYIIEATENYIMEFVYKVARYSQKLKRVVVRKEDIQFVRNMMKC